MFCYLETFYMYLIKEKHRSYPVLKDIHMAKNLSIKNMLKIGFYNYNKIRVRTNQRTNQKNNDF